MNEETAKEFLDEYVSVTKELADVKDRLEVRVRQLACAKGSETKRIERTLNDIAWYLSSSPLGYSREDAERFAKLFKNSILDAWEPESDE